MTKDDTMNPLTMNPNQVAILVWSRMTGTRETGRIIRRDCNYFPEVEACPEVKACVWSRDPSRLTDGIAYAQAEGMSLVIMDDTDDVLKLARKTP